MLPPAIALPSAAKTMVSYHPPGNRSTRDLACFRPQSKINSTVNKNIISVLLLTVHELFFPQFFRALGFFVLQGWGGRSKKTNKKPNKKSHSSFTGKAELTAWKRHQQPTILHVTPDEENQDTIIPPSFPSPSLETVIRGSRRGDGGKSRCSQIAVTNPEGTVMGQAQRRNHVLASCSSWKPA